MKRLLTLAFAAQVICASTSVFYVIDNMDMQGCRIYNLPLPLLSSEVATKEYVDNRSNIMYATWTSNALFALTANYAFVSGSITTNILGTPWYIALTNKLKQDGF